MSTLWLLLAIVALVAGVLHRRRVRADGTSLSDDAVRQIEEVGRVEVEEPLDLDAAREEEERFWSDWEEAEPW